MALLVLAAVIHISLLLQLRPSLASEEGSSPQITTHPSSTISAPLSTATLLCSATGTPLPAISWFKDDAAVTLGGRITQDSSGSLQITSVQNSDGGEYYCLASNTAGSVTSLTAELQVASISTLPSSTQQLQDVREHDPLVLSCTRPDSLPEATVTWYDGSSPIVLSDGRLGVTLEGSLVFSTFQGLSDTGSFSCEVSNDVISGSTMTSSRYLLQAAGSGPVFIPTEFVATPTDQAAIAGERVQLECFTTGSPLATISWQKDGVDVTAAGRFSFAQANRVLTIEGAEVGDAGMYTCVATQQSNSGPETTQTSAELTIRVPPSITQSFPETTIFVTQPATLACQAQGTTPLSWNWRLNGEDIFTSGRVDFTRNGMETSLTITSVQESDGGVYQCVVTNLNGIGVAAANELLIAKTMAPSFTHGNSLQDILVFTGTTVVLPCSAVGYPPPTFSWMKGTTDVDPEQEDRYSIPAAGTNSGSLTITDAVIGDSAIYVCIASNSAGSLTTPAIQLIVIGDPVIVGSPADDIPASGDTITLDCEVSMNVGITVDYIWTKDATLLSLGGRVTMAGGSGDLTIANIQKSDNGFYECSVELSVTGVSAGPLVKMVGSATITVDDPPAPPSPPLNPTVLTVTPTIITIEWDPPLNNGGLQIQSYTIEIQNLGNPACPQTEPEWDTVLTGASQTTANVEPLVPYTRYLFRVIAFNSGALESEPSEGSEVTQTEEDVPSSTPTSIAANPVSDEEVQVSWEPPSPCTTYNGVLTDYTLQYRKSEEEMYMEVQTGNVTSYLLTGLLDQTTYDIRVAAHTSAGRGPFSGVVMATTNEGGSPPGSPTKVVVNVLNSTAREVTWEEPAEGSDSVTTYIVVVSDTSGSVIFTVLVEAPKTSVVITGLDPEREYTFTVTSQNEHGSSPAVSATEPTPTTEAIATEETKPILEEVWFIAAVSIGGTVIVLVIVCVVGVIVCSVCCIKIGRDHGKIYVTSRRSASSLSGASSGFSEYQHKHRVMSKFVKIHSSPTPTSRTADYTDLESVRSTHSMHNVDGRPNFGYPSVNRADGQTDNRYPPILEHHELRYDREGMSSVQGQYDRNTPTPHTNGYDHMAPRMHSQPSNSHPNMETTVRLPSPPPFYVPQKITSMPNMIATGRGLSQESDDSWSPADNLNFRGHMSNRAPVSRTSSIRSGSSTDDARDQTSNEPPTPSGSRSSSMKSSDFRGHGSNLDHNRQISVQSGSRSQLPPLQEHAVMEGNVHGFENDSRAARVQHQRHKPPPRYMPPAYSRSLEQVGMKQGGESMELHPQYHTDSRTEYRHQHPPPHAKFGAELQHGHSPNHTSISNGSSQDQFDYPETPPPIPESNYRPPILPNRYTTQHQQQHDHRIPQNFDTRQGLSQPQPTLGVHNGPLPAFESPHQQQHDHRIPQNFDTRQSLSQPQPTLGVHNGPASHQQLPPPPPHMNIMDNRVMSLQNMTRPPPNFSHHHIDQRNQLPQNMHMSLQHLENRGRNFEPHVTSLQQLQEHQQNESNMPDVIQDSTSPQHIIKNSQRLPNLGKLTRLHPRKPKLKKTKIPGQVWEPRPMTRAIRSSSESESDSEDESCIGELDADPGDNTSLKSSHV